jgi:Putative transposase
VTFKWKDYRIKGRDRLSTMTLDAAEFIRRFLLHVLPSGFRRRNPGRERSRRVRRRSCPALQPFPQALPGCPAATGQDPSDEPRPPGLSALFQRSIFGYRLFGFCSLSGQFGELSISFS